MESGNMNELNTKMTAIADNIRELSGVSGNLGLDTMDSNLDSVIANVNTQEDLINQISTALTGKSADANSLKAEIVDDKLILSKRSETI
jgi:ABC-type transporter Mla subunit MlaD